MQKSLNSLLCLLVVFAIGCESADKTFSSRVRAHIAPMKPTYLRGVATYPNADDRDIRIEHWKQLERLLEVK